LPRHFLALQRSRSPDVMLCQIVGKHVLHRRVGETTAEYTGEIVRVPSMRTWPKPAINAINKTVRNYQHTQPLDPPRSAVRSLAAT